MKNGNFKKFAKSFGQNLSGYKLASDSELTDEILQSLIIHEFVTQVRTDEYMPTCKLMYARDKEIKELIPKFKTGESSVVMKRFLNRYKTDFNSFGAKLELIRATDNLFKVVGIQREDFKISEIPLGNLIEIPAKFVELKLRRAEKRNGVDIHGGEGSKTKKVKRT